MVNRGAQQQRDEEERDDDAGCVQWLYRAPAAPRRWCKRKGCLTRALLLMGRPGNTRSLTMPHSHPHKNEHETEDRQRVEKRDICRRRQRSVR